MAMFGLNDTASVYTPNGMDGDFTVLAVNGLACRLAYIEQGGSDIGGKREDLGIRRRLLWEVDYAMPDTAQVVISGQRWNVVAGTFGELRGPRGEVVYRRCEVVRAL